MTGFVGRNFSLMALAVAGLTAAPHVPVLTQQGTEVSSALVPNRQRSRNLWSTSHSYPNGPGWSVAQVKRMAKKRRNKIKAKRRKS